MGRLNDRGLGIEEPKHDLGWPSLRPLCRDNIAEKMRENEILQHNKDNSIIFSSDILLNV